MLLFGIFLTELVVLFLSSRFLTKSFSRLFFRITGSQLWTIRFIAILFFPGVVVHEVAHYLVARLLFVYAGHMEFLPKMQDGGVKLGSVAIAKTDPFRRALIGFAPVFVGLLVLFVSTSYLLSDAVTWPLWIKWVITGYIVFEVSNTMFSSKKDMEGTLELLAAVLVIGIALFFLGLRVPTDWVATVLQTQNVQDTLQTIVILLALPIGINAVVYGLLWFIGRK